MAAFAVLFGTRHIDATEHQDGLMLAVAAESIVKLVAFLAVGFFVTFWMFDGPVALVNEAMQRPSTATIFSREPRLDTLIAMTLLSFVAFIMLPRQFHVAVVENNNEDEIKRAVWLYPVYLVLINLFVVPIALAGLLTFPAGKVDSDMFVLALPLQSGSSLFTLIAFVGGLSAATAMVIVESVALSIMVSNDLIIPFVLKRRERLLSGRENIGSLLLTVRRLAIFSILLLAYVYYRSAGEAQLASIGLLSFAAIAQLAPAFFGRFPGLGLYAAAANALRHRDHRRTHPDRRALGRDDVAAATPFRPRCAAAGSRRDLESPFQHPWLYRLLASSPANADRAPASQHIRPFRPDTDCAELPALAFLGHGRRAHDNDCALSRRSTDTFSLRKFRRSAAHQP
jgi:hypothetical protein